MLSIVSEKCPIGYHSQLERIQHTTMSVIQTEEHRDRSANRNNRTPYKAEEERMLMNEEPVNLLQADSDVASTITCTCTVIWLIHLLTVTISVISVSD